MVTDSMEDLCTKAELVSFTPVPSTMNIGHDVTVAYRCGRGLQVTSLDWVGVYSTSSRDSQDDEPLAFQWAAFSKHNKGKRTKVKRAAIKSVTFPAHTFQGLLEEDGPFQYVYVTKSGKKVGVSSKFKVTAGAQEVNRRKRAKPRDKDNAVESVSPPSYPCESSSWEVEMERDLQSSSSDLSSDIVVLSTSPSQANALHTQNTLPEVKPSVSTVQVSSGGFIVTGLDDVIENDKQAIAIDLSPEQDVNRQESPRRRKKKRKTSQAKVTPVHKAPMVVDLRSPVLTSLKSGLFSEKLKLDKPPSNTIEKEPEHLTEPAEARPQNKVLIEVISSSEPQEASDNSSSEFKKVSSKRNKQKAKQNLEETEEKPQKVLIELISSCEQQEESEKPPVECKMIPSKRNKKKDKKKRGKNNRSFLDNATYEDNKAATSPQRPCQNMESNNKPITKHQELSIESTVKSPPKPQRNMTSQSHVISKEVKEVGQAGSSKKKSKKTRDNTEVKVDTEKAPDVKSEKTPRVKSEKAPEVKSDKAPEVKSEKAPVVKPKISDRFRVTPVLPQTQQTVKHGLVATKPANWKITTMDDSQSNGEHGFKVTGYVNKVVSQIEEATAGRISTEASPKQSDQWSNSSKKQRSKSQPTASASKKRTRDNKKAEMHFDPGSLFQFKMSSNASSPGTDVTSQSAEREMPSLNDASPQGFPSLHSSASAIESSSQSAASGVESGHVVYPGGGKKEGQGLGQQSTSVQVPGFPPLPSELVDLMDSLPPASPCPDGLSLVEWQRALVPQWEKAALPYFKAKYKAKKNGVHRAGRAHRIQVTSSVLSRLLQDNQKFQQTKISGPQVPTKQGELSSVERESCSYQAKVNAEVTKGQDMEDKQKVKATAPVPEIDAQDKTTLNVTDGPTIKREVEEKENSSLTPTENKLTVISPDDVKNVGEHETSKETVIEIPVINIPSTTDKKFHYQEVWKKYNKLTKSRQEARRRRLLSRARDQKRGNLEVEDGENEALVDRVGHSPQDGQLQPTKALLGQSGFDFSKALSVDQMTKVNALARSGNSQKSGQTAEDIRQMTGKSQSQPPATTTKDYLSLPQVWRDTWQAMAQATNSSSPSAASGMPDHPANEGHTSGKCIEAEENNPLEAAILSQLTTWQDAVKDTWHNLWQSNDSSCHDTDMSRDDTERELLCTPDLVLWLSHLKANARQLMDSEYVGVAKEELNRLLDDAVEFFSLS